MQRASKLVGKPIVSTDTGEKVGHALDLLVNSVGDQLVGVVVGSGALGSERVLPYENVQVLGEDTVLARRHDSAATMEQTAVLEALNCADNRHLPRLELLVVPREWFADVLSYSPFPLQHAWGGEHPRLLLVHQAAHAFAAYESGALVRWGPVSSGRRALATPGGLFHLTWRSRGRYSTGRFGLVHAAVCQFP